MPSKIIKKQKSLFIGWYFKLFLPSLHLCIHPQNKNLIDVEVKGQAWVCCSLQLDELLDSLTFPCHLTGALQLDTHLLSGFTWILGIQTQVLRFMETFNPHLQPLSVSLSRLSILPNIQHTSSLRVPWWFCGSVDAGIWKGHEKIMERTKEFKHQEMKLGNCSQLQRSNTFRWSGARKLSGEWAATKVKASWT